MCYIAVGLVYNELESTVGLDHIREGKFLHYLINADMECVLSSRKVFSSHELIIQQSCSL